MSSNATIRESLAAYWWITRVLWTSGRPVFAIYIAALLSRAAIPVLQLMMMATLIDCVAGFASDSAGNFSVIVPWLVCLAVLHVIYHGLEGIKSHSRACLKEQLDVHFQDHVLENVSRTTLADYDSAPHFDRVQRAMQASTSESVLVLDHTGTVLENTVAMMSFVALLATAHPAIPLILAAGATPVALSFFRKGRQDVSLYRRQTARQREATYLVALLTDRNAAKEIRIFDLGRPLIERWNRLAARLRAQRFQLAFRQQFKLLTALLCPVTAVVAVLIVLTWQTLTAVITVGAFFAMVDAALRLDYGFNRIQVASNRILTMMLYLSDLRSLQDAEATQCEPKTPLSAESIAIACEHVDFSYPNGDKVLHDISFTVRAGEKVVVMGENGAGKSSLVKILIGLYRPTSGRVLVNGVDLALLDEVSYHRHCSAFFQDFVKYQFTVQENIGLGDVTMLPDRTLVEETADVCGAARVAAELPERWDTLLGRHFQGGTALSHGQWQRLALARAAFRRGRLLVLDEPTTSLDAETRGTVLSTFYNSDPAQTVITVSHRPEYNERADRILVLNQGRLVENGSHLHLLEQNGAYCRLMSQLPSDCIERSVPNTAEVVS